MTLPSPPLALGASQPMYLGAPGSMQKLRMPDSGYQSVGARAEAVHRLISGGTAITKTPKTKRQWALPFTGMTEDTANLLVAFYTGAMGAGPFALVDPAWRNKYGVDTSSFGAPIQAISSWSSAVTSQALTYDTSVAAQFPQSGIMRWTGAGNGSKVGLGTWAAGVLVPRTADAPVYLSDQSTGSAIYARTASSTASLTYTLNGVNAAGAVQQAGVGSTVTVNSTGWTRIASFLALGSATALYDIPTILCNTASAPPILFCCADLQYGVTAIANYGAWVLGLGSPRVLVAPTASGGYISTSRLLPYRDQGLTLAEI